MKKSSRAGLLWYAVFFVLSLFIVLFIGYKTNSETGNSHMVLRLNGITQFKKGLDLAGGVRLTYKIDFSKYEETYGDTPSTLVQMKKTAQDIILKNIDKRISTLGVSDYNAYVQKLSDGEYVVVEIGGVQDLEAAKQLIGKTVELEFKLPNEEEQKDDKVYAERKKLAENIFAQVAKNPESFKELGENKGSQDVYYNDYKNVGLDELPMFYRNNLDKLTSVGTGKFVPVLFTGLYHMSITVGENENIKSTTLEGFTMVRFKDKEEKELETLQLGDVVEYIEDNDLSSERTVSRSFNGKTNDITYDAAKKSLVFVSEQELAGEEGYNVAIFKVNSGADSQAALTSIEKGERKNVEEVSSGWKSIADITAIVPSFTYNESTSVTLQNELDGVYIVKVREKKTSNDTIYPTVTIKVANEAEGNKIINALKHQVIYSFEDIHVSDKLQRLPAKDPKDESILNGTYFKYANVGQSQTGLPVVSIQFDDKGKEIFCNITEVSIGKQMAIFVGGELMTSPVIRDKICGGTAQIDGSFDIKGARKLADDLNSGALPAPLLLSHEETIAPSLGQNALNGALLSGAVGIILVYIIMLLLYGWKKANIGLIGLIAFLVYLLAIIKVLGIVSSLSGIAAIVLSLGMAVDSNVLMYERIREELKGGKSMATAIEDGYERSWSAIQDGNITVGIIGLLLFLVGVNVFKGFGTMMLINMLLILFVVAPLTKVLLRLFYKTK